MVLFITVIGINLFVRPEVQMIMFLETNFLVIILLSGGIGAGVSVISRMNTKRLDLDYEADRKTLVIIGIFRPKGIHKISNIAIKIV